MSGSEGGTLLNKPVQPDEAMLAELRAALHGVEPSQRGMSYRGRLVHALLSAWPSSDGDDYFDLRLSAITADGRRVRLDRLGLFVWSSATGAIRLRLAELTRHGDLHYERLFKKHAHRILAPSCWGGFKLPRTDGHIESASSENQIRATAGWGEDVADIVVQFRANPLMTPRDESWLTVAVTYADGTLKTVGFKDAGTLPYRPIGACRLERSGGSQLTGTCVMNGPWYSDDRVVYYVADEEGRWVSDACRRCGRHLQRPPADGNLPHCGDTGCGWGREVGVTLGTLAAEVEALHRRLAALPHLDPREQADARKRVEEAELSLLASRAEMAHRKASESMSRLFQALQGRLSHARSRYARALDLMAGGEAIEGAMARPSGSGEVLPVPSEVLRARAGQGARRITALKSDLQEKLALLERLQGTARGNEDELRRLLSQFAMETRSDHERWERWERWRKERDWGQRQEEYRFHLRERDGETIDKAEQRLARSIQECDELEETIGRMERDLINSQLLLAEVTRDIPDPARATRPPAEEVAVTNEGRQSTPDTAASPDTERRRILEQALELEQASVGRLKARVEALEQQEQTYPEEARQRPEPLAAAFQEAKTAEARKAADLSEAREHLTLLEGLERQELTSRLRGRQGELRSQRELAKKLGLPD